MNEFICMTREERIQFYLGKDLISGNYDSNLKETLISFSDFLKMYYKVDIVIPRLYFEPLRKLLIKLRHTDKKFKIEYGDIQRQTDALTLVKNRQSPNLSSVILFSLNNNRHWQNYYQRPVDIRFGKKINSLFWRGTSTGSLYRDDLLPSVTEYEKYLRPANRIDFVTKFFHKNPSKIDVGFSFLHRNYLKEKYGKYIKGMQPIQTFLKHKYLLSLEGNDKDSGLQWKLNSNSVVFMPKPTMTTWLMETTLIPDYHYVLLKDDFSNLEEKIKWCDDHPAECLQIIKHAKTFMLQFYDKQNELKIEEEVINRYFQLTE